MSRISSQITGGDLNNTSAARNTTDIAVDAKYLGKSLAIPPSQDEDDVRKTYRPFLLDQNITDSDWIARLELSTALKMAENDIKTTQGDRLKVMVLYGSMRKR